MRQLAVCLLVVALVPAAGATSLCRPDDVVLFTCPLANSHKSVSICASRGVQSHGYYVFGRQGAPELVYPQEAARSDPLFARTLLTFAGGTGGYAYSFSKADFKYIVYDVSGAGFESGGLMVQKTGSDKPVVNLQCRKGAIVANPQLNKGVPDKASGWPSDQEIERHGLPFTPRD